MAKLSDIEDAYMFVSSELEGVNRAFYSRKIDEIRWISSMADINDFQRSDFVDEEGEGGEEGEGEEDDEESDEEDYDDFLDPSVWVAIPHKHELDLGQQLVFEFVETHLPDESDRVYDIFGRRGAYGRFKDLLERRGRLQAWYDFENGRTRAALREWCAENDIPLEED